jgi:V/A-type H+-transporting ATPase subunit D
VPLKFQYNKIALQKLQKDLRIRENALPTLQAKESALRFEVKSAKAEVREAEEAYRQKSKELERLYRLWTEFPADILRIKDIKLDFRKIAGVKTPVFNFVEFDIIRFSLVTTPAWLPSGLILLKQAHEMQIKIDVARKKVEILEYARKKTTQKVNLYEKVQIPAYQTGILKIKRFLEDDENLAKSSQKILKERMARAEAA